MSDPQENYLLKRKNYRSRKRLFQSFQAKAIQKWSIKNTWGDLGGPKILQSPFLDLESRLPPQPENENLLGSTPHRFPEYLQQSVRWTHATQISLQGRMRKFRKFMAITCLLPKEKHGEHFWPFFIQKANIESVVR